MTKTFWVVLERHYRGHEGIIENTIYETEADAKTYSDYLNEMWSGEYRATYHKVEFEVV